MVVMAIAMFVAADVGLFPSSGATAAEADDVSVSAIGSAGEGGEEGATEGGGGAATWTKGEAAATWTKGEAVATWTKGEAVATWTKDDARNALTARREKCVQDVALDSTGTCTGSLVDMENCVLKCMAPTCYGEIYGRDPLEEGEIDVRGRRFRRCARGYIRQLRAQDLASAKAQQQQQQQQRKPSSEREEEGEEEDEVEEEGEVEGEVEVIGV
ncbi:hypothetical protein CBR_g44313 [Chara braunii]|uniref:Uncharacterized protein n=1 Tax=Chara braunii TaxID=69332 RepID=A0A388K310_CHABU|nr:hypothetical protein CBR_g44313 [Chara braunii]|eukprot:GBG64428.1 hypothetical protein CBR_g44313 [Chara braunii]